MARAPAKIRGLTAILEEGRKPLSVEFNLRGRVASIELTPASASARREIVGRAVSVKKTKDTPHADLLRAQDVFYADCLAACLPEGTPREDVEELLTLSGGATGPVAQAAERICGFGLPEGKQNDPFATGSQKPSER